MAAQDTVPYISTHALREEGDADLLPYISEIVQFLPTPSARRATSCAACQRNRRVDFYPRPPRGGRPSRDNWANKDSLISTHALREEGDRRSIKVIPIGIGHFYPRPPRGGRLSGDEGTLCSRLISTHALREEGDLAAARLRAPFRISTHALREEGDDKPQVCTRKGGYFYPRPPRGGRLPSNGPTARSSNFYPRPPRGGRHNHHIDAVRYATISTHALREEGDTLSGAIHEGVNISTHALREEGDPRPSPAARALRDFYPRPPRGGRPCWVDSMLITPEFLPTPSARRATGFGHAAAHRADGFLPTPSARRATRILMCGLLLISISTHALREEGDINIFQVVYLQLIFLPTPSARRATVSAEPHTIEAPFISTHALREEGDPLWMRSWRSTGYFYPRPPRGGRLVKR